MFSGGDYEEVGRWLWNFLTSHAKRENPRIEIERDPAPDREGVSYGARLRLGDRVSALIELDFKDVADRRGNLAWCAALAARVRALARELLG
jgi:hypothetical protein